MLPFVTTDMKLEGAMLSEISTERQILHGFTNTQNLKNKTSEKTKQQKNTFTETETKGDVYERGGVGG